MTDRLTRMDSVGTDAKLASCLTFFVNGRKVSCPDVDPEQTLLQFIRINLGLCGTKLGCAEGGCGACTVMVSRLDVDEKTVRHFAVNACLAPVCSVHGCAVTTVEGIGSIKTKLHPVQERIARSHGSQCGFCTPGIVMSMYTLLRNNPQPTQAEMENAFEGNLCRCTGYRPIIEGFKTFTKEFCCGGSKDGQCCMTFKDKDGAEVSTVLQDTSKFAPYDPSQEPIFPPELMSDNWRRPWPSLVVKGKRVTWHRPSSLEELLSLKGKYPGAKIVVGNSEIGIEVKFKNQIYPVLISPAGISQLHAVKSTEDALTVGAAVTLTDLGHEMEKLVKDLPEHKTRVVVALLDMLRWFAGHQIRNVACIGGNIMTGSPISDLNPLLIAAQSTLTLASKQGGERKVAFTTDFFTGYRRLAVKEDEVLLSVTIPFSRQNEFFHGFKQARRRDDDITIVNAGMRVLLCDGASAGSRRVQECSLVFGGMAATTVAATAAERCLVGKEWNEDIVQVAEASLLEALPLDDSAPGGMIEYRKALTLSFFFKFYMMVNRDLSATDGGVAVSDTSGTTRTERTPVKSSQIFQEMPQDQPAHDVVGRPVPHLAADRQATGEAVYIDDMPNFAGQLFAGFVGSKEAHAKLKSVDTSAALAMDGVHHYISAVDVPGSNMTGTVLRDEELFATEKVHCVGQLVGMVLADSQQLAQEAAKAVRVEYEPLEPIITIEEAIAAKSYCHEPLVLKYGNLEAEFAASDHVLEGELRIGGQEHFYLETQASLAVPGEEDEMAVYSSTQNPAQTQSLTADALGVQSNRVVCHVKRLGGGFGGKESRSFSFAIAAAVAARKTGRTVRFMLDRDEDISMTGQRHPFLARYKVGFMTSGSIRCLHIDMYANVGWSLDLSAAVLERAILSVGNCYKWTAMCVTGYLCRTNLLSNTAFRGFGSPQAMFFCESILTDVATSCGLPQEEVREKNFFRDGDVAYTNTPVVDCRTQRCWSELIDRCKLDQAKEEVAAFNRENAWKKRGISCIPTTFGVSFGCTFLNQAGALVQVYRDGSVLLTHGGVEMGQGLHTKMVQVCSRVFDIDISKVHISQTATDLVPNTSATAASVSSDLNGGAVKEACEKIMARLEPLKKANPDGKWEDWVDAAYFAQVSLSATGFFKVAFPQFDFKTNTGTPYLYYSYGAACSVVEIDTLTGDSQVLKTDIVMDVGNSLNPAIDIGQVEGAFVQGMGLFTLEELVVSPKGYVFSRGPGTYKIPGFADIPMEFNVALLRSAPNDKAIYSSKAVGEPPLTLSLSVFFAIKDAISVARSDNAGIEGIFRLDSPATVERIRIACVDRVTKQIPPVDPTARKFAVRP